MANSKKDKKNIFCYCNGKRNMVSYPRNHKKGCLQMGEEKELVQVILKMPSADLEIVKRETCVDMNATTIVAFIHKTLRERGLVED